MTYSPTISQATSPPPQARDPGPDPDTYRLLATVEVDARALSAKLDALLHQLQNEMNHVSPCSCLRLGSFSDILYLYPLSLVIALASRVKAPGRASMSFTM